MKVLMVGVDESTKGGMWTVVDNYLKNEHYQNDVDLKYIATSITGSIPKRVLFIFVSILKVLFYTLFNKYDILHVHMSEKGSVYRKYIVMKISKIRKAKIIIHMHGAEFEKWYKTLNNKKQNKVRSIINSCDKILILGNYWNKFIGSLMDDKSKVEVLYNAVFVPDEYKYDVNSKNILFLGLVGKRKGIYDLLDAMTKLKSNSQFDGKLLIYGPDDTAEGINNLIQNKKLSNFVEYCGWLKSEDKRELLQKISINVLPSYNEGLPMTILETMAYGIPNISTNVAAIPEAINKDNGIMIEPGNVEELTRAILELNSNDKLRKKLSTASYTKAINEFSIDSHINKLIDIYKKVNSGD